VDLRFRVGKDRMCPLRPVEDANVNQVDDAAKAVSEWEAFVAAWTPMLRSYLGRLHCGNTVVQELVNDILAEAYVVSRSDRSVRVENALRVSARQVSSSWKRSERKNARLQPLTGLEDSAEQSSPRDRERLWAWLDSLLAQLPEHQRTAIERHLDGLSDAVIATEIGTTVPSVRVLRHRGMQTLRRLAPLAPGDWEM
jgi:RNA polymerase sigma factor (sigma-70 family)